MGCGAMMGVLAGRHHWPQLAATPSENRSSSRITITITINHQPLHGIVGWCNEWVPLAPARRCWCRCWPRPLLSNRRRRTRTTTRLLTVSPVLCVSLLALRRL